MKKIIILFTAVAALLVAGCGSDTPDQVVDNFYRATQSKDFAKAVTYTDLEEAEKEVLITYLENVGMTIYSYEVLGSNIDEGDTTALVFVHLETANNVNADTSVTEINIPCVKEGRKWKVTFF